MKVKICGLTRREDAERAVALGATHLGCVLAADSPRRVDAGMAGKLLAGLSACPVLVFRRAPLERVRAAAEQSGIYTVQLHGFAETEARTLEEAGLAVHRAYDVEDTLPRVHASARSPLLLDVGGGGSGRAFDWSLLGPRAPRFVFVAGGVHPGNLAALLRHDPWGIDVSSGIETAPGIKDARRMQDLFESIAGATRR